jgi:NAD(P)-dependent dehydrogenase (short-subunit alcohol dehydrogenase family)
LRRHHPLGPCDEIGEKDFDDVVAINLTGAFNIISSFALTMVAQGSGSIVSVASVAAQRGGGLVGGSHYAASKVGVLSLDQVSRPGTRGGGRTRKRGISISDHD